MARRIQWLGRTGLAIAVGWMSIGCAEERDPINRVQATALSKHFFVGDDLSSPTDDPEFYMRNTVVDVPYGAAQDGLFTASYAQPVSRIKWEITETTLVGRQTYERVKDSDYNGARRTNKGQVVAMFAITSQFDIKRDYNPQTGEELNIVTENTTDRPWYQREYMRVDWSKNLVTDGYEVDTLSQIGVFGGVKWDPMNYYVGDPASPDAPAFDDEDGYFDVTTKAFATPQMIDTPFGTFPACFLPADYGGAAPVANCNPTEVTLRLSFRKVTDNDFEPEDWTGTKQDAFGWFTMDRYGYERNYGILDEKWHRFAAKYNIWGKSHVEGSQCAVDVWRDANGDAAKYKVQADGGFALDGKTGLPIPDANGKPYPGTPVGADVHRDADGDKTEDECAFKGADGSVVHPGSRCDEFSQKCTLPHYERDLKTIPWFYGPDSAPDLFAATANALGQWNLAVKRAAQIGKMVEARRVGLDTSDIVTDEDALRADAGKTVPDVFVLCHNPSVEGDADACFKRTKDGEKRPISARLGDIRYNLVNIIQNPQSPSPWGIMVDADDPLTGEKVSTSVNEWGHVLDTAAQATEDLIRWINGEISDQQVVSGKYLHDWASASKLGTSAHQPPPLDAHEIASRIASVDTTIAKSNGMSPADLTLPKPLQRQKASNNLAKALGPSMDPTLEGARQSLIGTKWEAQMITPEWLQAAGMDPKTPVAGDDATLAKASPLRGMHPGLSKWIKTQRNNTMAQRAACMVEEPEPDALVGLARQAQRLYPLPDPKAKDYAAQKNDRDDRLHQWIREQFHTSVIAHEMGHSMGLRHNFTGSYDALNYKVQYWQLRTRNGKERACADAVTPHTDGHDCVGPRWVDPITDEETNGLVWKWGSTTVMDYPGDQTQDMNDIGPYDKAAMRFGYADVVDLDADAKSGTPKGNDYLLALDGFGGIGGQTIGGNHYSQYADKYKVLGTCAAQTDPADPLSAKCSGFNLQYAAERDMLTLSKFGDAVTAIRPDLVASFGVDPKTKLVRHPYMFGSDEFADVGNVPVFRFDAGADSYEQFQFLISTYEDRYVFDNFRRDRTTFNSRAVVARGMDRTFDKVQGMTKSLALLVGLETNAASALADPGNLMPLALGASDGLAMFARVITRPEPGPYASQAPSTSGMPLPYAEGEDINGQLSNPNGDFRIALGSGEGRYIHNDYDYTQGYYWSDYQLQVGSAFEKANAFYYLTEAYNRFVSNSKEDYIDGRYKNLSYFTLYPNQVRRLLTQVQQNDPMRLGPYVTPPQGATGDNLAHVRYVPWEKYDPKDPTTIDLDYPSDGVVLSPLVGWEQQYHALIQEFVYGPTTLTMDLVNQLRVYSPGDSATVSIDPKEQVRYRDPFTGVEYVARTYGKETVNSRTAASERSSGARMLQFANELAASTYESTADATGELTYARDANGDLKCKLADCTTRQLQLKNYASNIDVVRQLTLYFGYGPLGH